MVIHGTGCCLMDFLYADTDFSGPAFIAASARKQGDQGLHPGRLVFADDLEAFTGRNYAALLAEICAGAPPVSCNLGGPSAVSLAHASQIVRGPEHAVAFYGAAGTDETSRLMRRCLERIPFTKTNLVVKEGTTPRTDVLSDPRHDNGQGERTFIHIPGDASFLCPEDLGDDFFDAHIAAFGGTALLPPLHKGLTGLLRKARQRGALTVVNLVYDYQSDLRFPGRKWKLGEQDDAYPFIDILIADRDEALKTAGQRRVEDAARWFLAQGAGAAVITQGARPVVLIAKGGFFAPLDLTYLPVSQGIDRECATGDTTGCGDNFAGGLIVALAEQPAPAGAADLREACIPAAAAGGFARMTIGGVFYEQYAGEKRALLAPYLASYRQQLARPKSPPCHSRQP
ncbi:MAG: carbohydrate kinase family protein [Spirochaetaceae bacterium]|jgi:sugar/nucleoside kinase (ribokinase family)|nr:carbohydrate kinase family protein [Spirochaetaceae bacterium]